MTKVFVNGTFDIIHYGHLELLKYAKAQGSFLHVALDSDTRIKSKKGNDRPFNNQLNRTELMKSIKYVDEVSVFDSDDELKSIIKQYSPDIMIVGSDWKNKIVIGSEYTKKLIFFDRISDVSTTKTIQDFINRRHLC
jgi:D-beta-D-heptose 7-phosphate kinase/D-beta-D-heptose 1-phosphate adenosyltransferase